MFKRIGVFILLTLSAIGLFAVMCLATKIKLVGFIVIGIGAVILIRCLWGLAVSLTEKD